MYNPPQHTRNFIIKEYIPFFKHWFIECFFAALLYYIMGESIYIIARLITPHLYGLDNPSNPDNPNFITIYTAFDYAIPFVKYFIVPYTTAYSLWVVGPFLIYGFLGRQKFYQFMYAAFWANLISLIIFIIVPNGIKSDFRPTITQEQANSDFFYGMCKWTFDTDSYDQAFPSGHWVLCLLIMIAMRKSILDKNASRACRATAISIWVYGILICMSTFFVKQHYIFDAIVSIPLCEVLMFLVTKLKMPGKIEEKMYKFNVKIGLIKGDVRNTPSHSSKELIWYRILWGTIAVLVCFSFWETQWFIQEFLLNIGAIVAWLLLVFSYYGVRNLYKNHHH